MTYCESLGTHLLNLSFAVVEGGEIVAICPIIQDGSALLYDSNPCPQPIWSHDSARDEMRNHLRYVMDAYRVDHYDFRGTYAGTETHDLSWKTRIIDLQPMCDIEVIQRWLNVRKSYKSLVNNADKTHRIYVSREPRDVYILQVLHREQSGRDTRPQSTWDAMAAWVQSGHAYLCLAWNVAGICDGAVYIYTYKGMEYYGHAATRSKDINHALIWEAIQTSTSNRFDMGWQGHATSKKGRDIEFFRRGFGGTDQPFPVSRMYAS